MAEAVMLLQLLLSTLIQMHEVHLPAGYQPDPALEVAHL